ncbi:site-specific integrase [Paraburkholderia sp. Se-20369]|nr:site-specific integrase [Paraburkholderia sp. Se-20369]
MPTNWRLGQRVWVLERHALVPDETFAIDWGALLPKYLGTRHRRNVLVRSCQELFRVMYGPENIRGREYMPSTLEERFAMLRALIRWMAYRSIWKFSKLSVGDVINFLHDRRGIGTVGSPIARSTLDDWIFLFREMWVLKSKYSFPVRINVDDILDEIYSRVSVRSNGRWRPLETNLAMNLVREALLWIDKYGQLMIEIVAAVWQELEKIGIATKSVRYKRMLPLVRGFLSRKDCINFIGDIPSKVGGWRKVALGLSIVEGACVFLMFILVGMRASEILALEHNCLVEEISEDGSRRTYIRGIAAKKRGLPRVWVADEPVLKILRFWTALMNPIRTGRHSSTALWVSRPSGGSFFNPQRRQHRWSRSVLLARVRGFLRFGCAKVRDRPSSIHPHQLRKTFAKLAVQRNKSNLEPVAAQLGHAYKSFTDNKYVGVDHELSELLAEEDRKELAQCLEALLSTNNIIGKAAPALAGVRQDIQKFRGKHSLRNVVEKLINDGVIIAPCDWGFCVYAKTYSACHGDEKGPNPIYRSPDVCASCSNFVVTPEHRVWWEARAIREEEFLRRENIPEQTVHIVSQRLKRTREVLAQVVRGARTRESVKD